MIIRHDTLHPTLQYSTLLVLPFSTYRGILYFPLLNSTLHSSTVQYSTLFYVTLLYSMPHSSTVLYSAVFSPCLMRSTTARTEGVLLVNGAATPTVRYSKGRSVVRSGRSECEVRRGVEVQYSAVKGGV